MGDFLSVISQAKTRIDALNQQKSGVDVEIDKVSSDMGVASSDLDGKQSELSNAQVELSNFQIPETIDAPDRAAFTTTDEDGNEVFDQAAFDEENAKYEASVRAHDEAVAEKQRLESDVAAKQGEVDQAQSNVDQLGQTKQAKTEEQAVIVDDLNEAIEELRTAEAQQAEVEAEAAKVAEVESPEEVAASADQTPEEEQHYKEVAVQNNKGWDHYAKMELEAELGRTPTQQEIRERSDEVKQRNIDAGKVNEKGALVVGRDKTVLLKDEVDETNLQTGEEAVQAYKDGQAYVAEQEAKAQAEAEAEQAAIEAKVEANKKDAEEALKSELSSLTKEELDRVQNAEDMSDDAIDDAIGEVMGDLNKLVSVGAEGQDIGKLTGRLAKKYGYKNAQKIVGRVCNTVAKKAGKAIPGMNVAMAGYGVYKVANGDMSGLFDIADVAVSYIPIVGTAISLIGTENIAMVIGKGIDENVKMLANGDMHGRGFMGGHCMR